MLNNANKNIQLRNFNIQFLGGWGGEGRMYFNIKLCCQHAVISANFLVNNE